MCNAVAYQLSSKDYLSVSAWMDIDFLITLKITAVTKHQQFAEWNAMHLLPISSFPISHFLVPTFRVIRSRVSLVPRPHPILAGQTLTWGLGPSYSTEARAAKKSHVTVVYRSDLQVQTRLSLAYVTCTQKAGLPSAVAFSLSITRRVSYSLPTAASPTSLPIAHCRLTF